MLFHCIESALIYFLRYQGFPFGIKGFCVSNSTQINQLTCKWNSYASVPVVAYDGSPLTSMPSAVVTVVIIQWRGKVTAHHAIHGELTPDFSNYGLHLDNG